MKEQIVVQMYDATIATIHDVWSWGIRVIVHDTWSVFPYTIESDGHIWNNDIPVGVWWELIE